MKTQFDTLSFSAQALAAIVGGNLVRPTEHTLSGLVSDSRTVEEGNIFLALRGENTDGHNYIQGAAERGAACIIAETIEDEVMCALPAGCAVILVPNTLFALGTMAKWYLATVSARVLAITGSVGKTTTKQMIHAVLSTAFQAMRTEGNYNNEIGLPLTLMQIKKDDEIAVLEAGMSFPNELYRLSHICTPELAVITNIGSSHIENLGSREGIRDAKLELLSGIQADGTVILQGDEPLLFEKKDDILARGLHPVYFAKDNRDGDALIQNIRLFADSSVFDLYIKEIDTHIRDIHVPTAGEHNVYNAAAAYLCGRYFGMEESQIKKGLLSFENTGARQKLRRIGDISVLEDCYNASPESMEAALNVLTEAARANGGRAIAVLGDMRELGTYAPILHTRVGKYVHEKNVSLLFTLGHDAQSIARGAIASGMEEGNTVSFENVDDIEMLANAIKKCLLPHDTVLFKASRAVALERVIAHLFPEA